MKALFRTLDHSWTILITLITLTLFHGCRDENIEIPVATIKFNTSTQNVSEGTDLVITLSMDHPASRDVTFKVWVQSGGVYGLDFVTIPAAENGSIVLTILKGETKAQFLASTIDNNTVDNLRSILFTLTSPSEGLKLGTATSSTLTILDDEGPSMANFETNSGILMENSDTAIELRILLSRPAQGEGSLVVQLSPNNTVYGTDFTTDPGGATHSITLPVSRGQTYASIFVSTIDNNRYNANEKVIFLISAASGVVQKGEKLIYSLSLGEDEVPSKADFVAASGTVDENDRDGIEIGISISKPLDEESALEVSISSCDRDYASAIYGRDYVTEPAGFGGIMTLMLSKYQTSTSFKVVPLDNQFSNYHKSLQFSISDAKGSLVVGNNSNYNLLILDNEIAEIGFAEQSGTIDEGNTSGIVIKIDFDKPLSQATQIFIEAPAEYQDTFYGSIYSTLPEMTAVTGYDCLCGDCEFGGCESTEYRYYLMTLVAPTGSTSISFTILPIDNMVRGSNSVLTFNLFSNNDLPSIIKGGTFELTIVDND